MTTITHNNLKFLIVKTKDIYFTIICIIIIMMIIIIYNTKALMGFLLTIQQTRYSGGTSYWAGQEFGEISKYHPISPQERNKQELEWEIRSHEWWASRIFFLRTKISSSTVTREQSPGWEWDPRDFQIASEPSKGKGASMAFIRFILCPLYL